MKTRRKILSKSTPILFIFPALLVLIVFRIVPIFQAAWLSLMDYSVVNPSASKFIGFDNFRKLFSDRFILPDLWHTVEYSIGTVIFGLLISFLLSLILTESWFRLANGCRAILFLPYIISFTITGMLWAYIYNPTFGLLNYALSAFGIPPQPWLGDPSTAMLCIVIMSIWKSLGYNVIIWTAGITSISTEYRDAAKVDGANYWQELIHIRIPLLRPVITFLLILGFIGSFQSFDAVYVMTLGGPVRSTEVIVFYLWKIAFKEYNFGYAAAISLLVFVILVILSLIQFKFLGKEEKA